MPWSWLNFICNCIYISRKIMSNGSHLQTVFRNVFAFRYTIQRGGGGTVLGKKFYFTIVLTLSITYARHRITFSKTHLTLDLGDSISNVCLIDQIMVGAFVVVIGGSNYNHFRRDICMKKRYS